MPVFPVLSGLFLHRSRTKIVKMTFEELSAFRVGALFFFVLNLYSIPGSSGSGRVSFSTAGTRRSAGGGRPSVRPSFGRLLEGAKIKTKEDGDGRGGEGQEGKLPRRSQNRPRTKKFHSFPFEAKRSKGTLLF